jgi:hypothetical protein
VRRRRKHCSCGHEDLPLFRALDAAGASRRDPEDDAPIGGEGAAIEGPAAESVPVDPPAIEGPRAGPELDAREVWDAVVTPGSRLPGLAARVRELGPLRESPRSRRSSDRSLRPWAGLHDDDPPAV